MIEIGKTRMVCVQDKKTGKAVTVEGEPLTMPRSERLQRETRDEYGHNSKYRRKLIITLQAKDVVMIKPKGLRTCAHSATVWDIYQWMVRSSANKAQLEKAREKKARQAAALASRRVARADRLFRQSIHDKR